MNLLSESLSNHSEQTVNLGEMQKDFMFRASLFTRTTIIAWGRVRSLLLPYEPKQSNSMLSGLAASTFNY